jgi:hypothetical protein
MIRLVFEMQRDLAEKHSLLAEVRAQVVDSDVMQTILARNRSW